MGNDNLSVRELQESDLPSLIHYWLSAEPAFLRGMGVDLNKMPTREEWTKALTEHIRNPLEKKQSYCMIWLVNNTPVGHSNINKITRGEEAYMHLHLWNSSLRKKGMGTALVKMTLPHFFEKFNLKKVCCEPYALNPAPSRTLEKVGFTFVKIQRSTPGWLNSEQETRLWEMTYDAFKKID